jgi:hypothetical protein
MLKFGLLGESLPGLRVQVELPISTTIFCPEPCDALAAKDAR